MAHKQLVLIDATAFCYRAFFALKGLSTSFGQPTNAVYGFINILNKVLKEKKPDYLGICFDVSRDTFRQKKFAAYKIQRAPMPDDLKSQIPLIKEVVRAFGLLICEKEGFEADDIIAALAGKAKAAGLFTTIVSSDKDILQLVDEHTLVFSPHKDEGITYDTDKVRERFGVQPGSIPDILGLMGDSADNIPGARGIGEKTAAELVKSFGSIENLLRNIDKIKQEKLRSIVRENKDNIILSRELAVLDGKMELDLAPEELVIGRPDYKELTRLFKYLEFKRFLKGLPVEKLCPGEFTAAAGDGEMVVYAGQSLGGGDTKALINPQIKKIGHDLKAEKLEFIKKGLVLEGAYFDTMIAAYLLNPSKAQYQLSDLALDYLGINLGDQEITKDLAFGIILKLKPILENELAEKSLAELFYKLEMPLVEVLADMQACGIKLDEPALEKLSGDIQQRLIKLIADIYEASGTQFNINSPKQLGVVLFEKLKLPVIRRSKTGPSTNEEVLRELSGRHKLPALLLEYRQLTKLKNTYIDALPLLVDKATGKIHASFNQTGTETGRLSSSNPNLQNIPVKTDIGKLIRKAVIAYQETDLLLACDYSQIELRVLAHISKDENLIAAFKAGKDIHRATAALIYGLDEKDVDDKSRDMAKRINFGIVYGLSAYGLSRDLGIPLEEAGVFIDAYFNRYPGVKDYIDKQINIAREQGFVSTLLGRRRYIPEINNKNQGIRQFAQRQAVNAPIQGSASDLIKLAMVKIHGELIEKKLEAKMIMQIHDELVFNLPERELSQAAELVRERMENVLELDVPVKVEIKKGKNWLDMEPI
ncbi:MAG: DNA polymerase I [Candidatus Omnitrophota bacterium]